MAQIYQGTSGYLDCNVWGADLTGVQSCVVSIDCGQIYNFDLTRLSIAYDPEAVSADHITGMSAVVLHLRQTETLALRNATGSVQVRWKDASGENGITDIVDVDIGKAIYKGVL